MSHYGAPITYWAPRHLPRARRPDAARSAQPTRLEVRGPLRQTAPCVPGCDPAGRIGPSLPGRQSESRPCDGCRGTLGPVRQTCPRALGDPCPAKRFQQRSGWKSQRCSCGAGHPTAQPRPSHRRRARSGRGSGRAVSARGHSCSRRHQPQKTDRHRGASLPGRIRRKLHKAPTEPSPAMKTKGGRTRRYRGRALLGLLPVIPTHFGSRVHATGTGLSRTGFAGWYWSRWTVMG
jgi:hypothetical protein